MDKKKYTFQNIILSLIILTIAYIYCFIFTPIIENINDDSVAGLISKIHKTCFMNCKSKQCKDIITNFRGDTYFISTPKNEQKNIHNCIITFWGLTHIILYFILTFLIPSFYIEFFILGILFEIYEYYFYKCHDITDIFLNTLGIIIGKYLSPYNT
jgi:hypothetical protein